MEEYLQRSSSGYVSCIRINGKPILPPLVDAKRKAELLHYKNLAILAEKKQCDRKMLKNDRHSIDSGVIISGTGILSSVSSPHSERAQVKNKIDRLSSNVSRFQPCPKNNINADLNIFDILLSTKPEFDDATFSFLMNCCDEFCQASFHGKTGSEYAVVSEVNGSERSPSVSYVETLSSERDCLSSSVSVGVNEKCELPCEIGQESKPNEESERCGSELERTDISFPDRNAGIIFTKKEHDNLTELCSKEQFTDAVVKTFERDGSSGKNGDTSCSFSLKSPDLQLVPPGDKLNVTKTLVGHSISHHNPYVTLRTKSDSQLSITSFVESPSKISFAKELFTSERNSDYSKSEELANGSYDFGDEIAVSVTHLSSNILNDKSQDKQVDSIKLTSLSGPSSADLSNSSASSKTVVKSPHCIRNISEPNTKKVYDPSLYDGNGTVGKKTPEVIDLEVKISNNFQVVDEQVYISTDLQVATVPNVVCDLRGNHNEGSASGDTEDWKSVENSVAFSKHSGETSCISDSVSASELDFCSTLSASEHSKSTLEPLVKETLSSPPRLLRQNSYTLEAPSPALLAHLKGTRERVQSSEQEGKGEKGSVNTRKESGGRRGWDLKKAEEEWKCDARRLVFAVSCKEEQALRLKTDHHSNQRENSGKAGSLPGSHVSSPVKANPCHSSLENISPSGIKKPVSSRPKLFHSRLLPGGKSSKRTPLVSQASLSNRKNKSIYSVSYSELYHSTRSSRPNHIRTRSKSDLSEQISRRKCSAVGRSSLQQRVGSTGCNVPSQTVNSPEQEIEKVSSVNSSQKAKPSDNRMKNSVLSKSIEELFKNGSVASTVTDSVKGSESDKIVSSDEKQLEEIPGCNRLTQSCSNESSGEHVVRNTQSVGVSVAESVTPRPDITIQEIFQQLQNQHSQLMAQLLDRQKKEQEALAATFLNQQRLILQEMNIIRSPSTSTDSPRKSQSIEMHDSGTQISLSIETSPEANSCSHPAESHLSSAVEMTPHCGTSHSNGHSNASTPSDTGQLLHHEELQLPGEKSEIPQKAEHYVQRNFSLHDVSPRKEKAATVINAAVRGYLTRRLFKTDHVQSIIKTISETVQCALQLQRECPGDITPSDIELHKRLIQQLTAACYTLHDTFFALSTRERMTIIANDRERLQRNLQIRPSSSISSATRKYLQRKQMEQQQGGRTPRDRPTSSRRSWWQSKSRSSSGGHYEQTPNFCSKPKTQQNNRGSRRPWR